MSDFPSYGTIPQGVIKLEIASSKDLKIEPYGKFQRPETLLTVSRAPKPGGTSDQGYCED